MQQLVKNSYSQEDMRPRLGLEAICIAKHNRSIAKARVEGKKQKKKHGMCLPNPPLPSLIEHPSFYGCSGLSGGEVELPQQLPQAANSSFHPWLRNHAVPGRPSSTYLRQLQHLSGGAMAEHLRWDCGHGARISTAETAPSTKYNDGGFWSGGGGRPPSL